MIKKIVLAFLLLFFSSVSFADFQFYSDSSSANSACLADKQLFTSLLSSPTPGYYSCTSSSVNLEYDSLSLNYTPYATFVASLMSRYSICSSPKVISSKPSIVQGLNFSNSCIVPPVCVSPKVLNDAKDACVDPPSPGYKKWVKNKSLGVELCNSDSVDSKFLALTPDPYPGMIMCTEESTRVTLRIGINAGSAVIINEYSVCEFPKKITDVPSGGYVNSCGDAPPDGTKTSCPTGQMLYKGNCYNVTNASTGSTSGSTSGSTTTSGGSTSTGSTLGDTSTMSGGSTSTGSTSSGSTSGDMSTTSSGSTSTGSTLSGSTSGDTSTTSSGSTSTGSTSTGSSSGDTSFSCPDGSVISPPLDCPKQYCGYLNGVYACYDAVGNMDSTGSSTSTSSTTSSTSGDTSTSTGSTSTGSTSGDTSIPTGSTSTGSTSGDTSTSIGSTSTGSTTSGSTTGSTSTGSTTSSTSTGSTSTSTGSTSGDTSTSTGSTSTGSTSGDTSTSTGSTSTGSTSGDTSTSTGSTSTGSTSGDTSTSTGSTSTSSTTSSTTGSSSTGSSSSGSTSTGASSSGSGTSSAGDGSNSSGGADCSTLQGAVNCMKGSGSAKSFSKKGDGNFGSEADDALKQAQKDLADKIKQVKQGFKDLMPSLDSNGGSCDLPSFKIGTIKGVEVERNLNDWCGELGVLASAFGFLSAVVAFRIIFGGG